MKLDTQSTFAKALLEASPRMVLPAPIRQSKHNRKGNDATGPEAAKEYVLRRKARPGGGASQLKKLARAVRIEMGLRPLRYDTRSDFLKAR